MSGRLLALERLLLPNVCVVCEGAVETHDALVCRMCRARMRPLAAGCARCRQPVPPVGACRFCAEWPEALGRVHSAVWLDREARELLHHLKYGGYWRLAEVAAEVIDRSLARRPDGALCPVPLGPRRFRERGYNQAEEIARALGARWRRPVLPSLLSRPADTRSQTALDPARRRKNVAGVFAAAPVPGGAAGAGEAAAGGKPRGAIILVDDVLTTGATVAAGAAALAGAGWTEVTAVTFARAQPFVRRLLLD